MSRRVASWLPRRCLPALVAGVIIAGPQGVSATKPVYDRMGVESTGTIRVYADYCAFRGDSLASLVEIYIQTLLDGVTFVTAEDGSVDAEIAYDAFLVDGRGETALKSWTMPVHLETAEDAVRPGLSLYDRLDLAVKPGAYDLELKVRDLHGAHTAEIALPIFAADFWGPAVSLSDLQLARSVTRSDDDDLWLKNGYRVLPNPSRRYGAAQPTLYCYAESYGLRPTGEAGEFCTVLYEVVDLEGKRVYQKGPFLLRRVGESAVLVETIDIRDLAPGYYRLAVSLEDTSTFSPTMSTKSSAMFVRTEDLSSSTPMGLSPAESTAAEVELRFAASPAEVRKFRELNPVGRATFLDRFWAAKDPDTSTPENEARAQLHARIAQAQGQFREMGRDGMDTDRGRVFITHGPPSEISRVAGELTCKDHEVWMYHREREYEFVFFDETGSNSYRLIHSNYPGEVSRPGWPDIVCETPKVQTF
ncbi:GWxTD domain-containing protein [Candidatus Fermentibacteria bacterium]|nr:GWxTD domain-containing protein [Candidatus Fermentibacteria bacterium]